MRGHTDWIFTVAVTPDGKYAISGSRDGSLKVWDLANWRNISAFEGDSFFTTLDTLSDKKTIVAIDMQGITHLLQLWE